MTRTLVVMGVSGVGKSAVAAELATLTGWQLGEGDDLHDAASRVRMAAGQPLQDEHRLPWLRRVADWIGQQEDAGRDAVITCSALRRRYRDLLRDGHPSVHFVHLVAAHDLLEQRVSGRSGHFMPPALLTSQLRALEPLEPDEPGAAVDATDTAADTARLALDRLGIPA